MKWNPLLLIPVLALCGIASVKAEVPAKKDKVATRFVPVRKAELTKTALYLNEQMSGSSKDFQVVPDIRTRRVFIKGTMAEVDRATSLLALYDVEKK